MWRVRHATPSSDRWLTGDWRIAYERRPGGDMKVCVCDIEEPACSGVTIQVISGCPLSRWGTSFLKEHVKKTSLSVLKPPPPLTTPQVCDIEVSSPRLSPDTTAVNCTSPASRAKTRAILRVWASQRDSAKLEGTAAKTIQGPEGATFAFMIWTIPRAFPPMTYVVLPADVYGFFRSHNTNAFSTRRINVNK